MRNLMSSAVLCASLLLCTRAQAGPHLQAIKVSVTNPSSEERLREPIVIPISALRQIAPDLRAGSLVVTMTHASDLQQDAATLQTTEIPSQVDDLDDDANPAQLAFQPNFKPPQPSLRTTPHP